MSTCKAVFLIGKIKISINIRVAGREEKNDIRLVY